MKVKIHKNDLPSNLNPGKIIAIDTETMGLDYKRDPLCLVQISSGDEEVHLIQINRKTFKADNLKKILEDNHIKKIFQFARFDLAVLNYYLKTDINNVYCTKIASKIGRTYTDKHGLKDLCKELLNIELSKQMQSSDWGAEILTEQQINYAASDVLYLHKIKEELDKILIRENRMELAEHCFKFLKHRVTLDLAGWNNQDIFAH
ncbi:MAG: ribonuclease D [Proteobacteria bacterium]|jgi:ribonuclease D|nr:ribonuclease D [Candidatus Fonsibacter sp. PEL5]NKA17024.1 ribonuclease D [Candidatus Fonsibacter sp. PEL55]